MEDVPEVFCLPIKEKKKNKWHIITHPQFGKGQAGVVYGACKREDCAYVMKVITFGKRFTAASFDKEVKIQTELASHGITIPVEDSWKCKMPIKMGVIIMRSLDITVKDFLIQDISVKDADHVISGVTKLMQKLHNLGYYHGDNHFANIMMKRVSNDSSVDTSLGKYRLYLIDFGKSGTLAEPGYQGIRPSTSSKRIKEDNVILEGEIRQALIRFHPERIESAIL